MAVIQLYLTYGNRTAFLRNVDQTIIKKHSATIRDALQAVDPNAQSKRVKLVNVSPGPLNWVLDRIISHRERLHIKVGDRQLHLVVALYETVEALRLEPAQPQIDGHIVGYLAHEKISPAGMKAVNAVFEGRQQTSKFWGVMVHQIARDIQLCTKYTAKEFNELEEEAKKHPSLFAAVNNKVQELQSRQARYEAAIVKKQEAQDAKKDRKQAHEEQNDRDAEVDDRVREYDEIRWWEESNGLRATSEETVELIRTHKFAYKVTDQRAAKTDASQDEDEDVEQDQGNHINATISMPTRAKERYFDIWGYGPERRSVLLAYRC